VEESQNVAVAFTLKHGVSEALDEQGRDVYKCEYALTIAPAEDSSLTFEETEIALNASFVSKQLKSAATSVNAQLSVSSGTTTVKIALDGASRKKWTPEAIPTGMAIDSFADEAIAQFLPGAALRGLAVLNSFLNP
jgi:hypothetical protein